MTGYLHIKDGPKVRAALADELKNLGYDSPAFLRDLAASSLLRVLRGLSVEPTDDAEIRADERQRLADQLDRVLDAIEGSPAHQLRMEPGTAIDGLHRAADYLRNCGPRPRRDEGAPHLAVAAPVPVQEDRP